MMNSVELPNPPQRILLIKPSSLGDVVHALPVLNLIKRKWPSAKVSWLVTPACAGIVEGHPQLEEVLIFERRRLGNFWRSAGAAAGLFRLARTLKERRFDLVVDLQGLFRSGWMARRTRALVRVGLADARELAWLFYTHRIDAGGRDQHAVTRNLKVAEALGCGSEPVEFIFPIGEADRRYVAERVGNGPYAALLPGATWATKRWPVERYAGLVGPLKEWLGLRSVVAGGPDAVELGARIAGARDLTGRTTLRQLAALLEKAALVIANDSGPMHIAAALGRPLVAIFGPTDPARTGPYGRSECVLSANMECRPCFRRRCTPTKCMEELGVEKVMEAAERQVRR